MLINIITKLLYINNIILINLFKKFYFIYFTVVYLKIKKSSRPTQQHNNK